MDVPTPGSDWEVIGHFALTWNGYERAGVDAAGHIANDHRRRWDDTKTVTDRLDDLRTSLFFEQRRWRHFGATPDSTTLRYIDAILQAITEQTGGTIAGDPDPLP